MRAVKKISLLCLFIFFLTNLCSQNTNGIAKGTIITLADGTNTNIESLVVGAQLLTIDAKNISVQISTIKSIEKATVSSLAKVTLADGNELILTPNHPILGYKGWASYNKKASKEIEEYSSLKIYNYKENSFVYNLNPSMELRVLPIIEVKLIKGNFEIYKIELDNSNTAFVAGSLLVGQ